MLTVDEASMEPENLDEGEEVTLDINDNTFEVNTLNSNRFEPKKFAKCDVSMDDPLKKPEDCFPELDMVKEQAKDDEILELKTILVHGDPGKDTQRKHLIVDGVLYYLSDPDNDPILRLYVPRHLRTGVITQYHDGNGHMGVQKSFDGIRQKYYWPNLYKEIYQYVTNCVVCKTRSLQKVKQPLQETDIPPFPMAKLSLDLSGPYPTSLSGNKYIIAFVDWFSGWPEAFAVPDKTADTVANLLIEEIYPRYGCPLQIVTDNGTENVNQVMRETLEAMNIHHVLTSVYHPLQHQCFFKIFSILSTIQQRRGITSR